jgi:hypothetical protein
MALQGSGQIKMSEINVELGRNSTDTISLDAAESGTYAAINTASPSYPSNARPASMSEWYSYDHSASVQSGNISTDAAASSEEACPLERPNLVYKSGSSQAPLAKDTIWNDSNLASQYQPAAGFNQWYSYQPSGSSTVYSVFLIESSSTTSVDSVSTCG